MPCDQIRTTVLDTAKMDLNVLSAALKRMGYRAQHSVNEQGQPSVQFTGLGMPGWGFFTQGKLSLPESEKARLNDIQKAYTKEVVIVEARRLGWTFGETADGQMTLTRRSF